ncbi:hypothetical protein ACFTAO_42055 [Paenibacillus rhizoplanae]
MNGETSNPKKKPKPKMEKLKERLVKLQDILFLHKKALAAGHPARNGFKR